MKRVLQTAALLFPLALSTQAFAQQLLQPVVAPVTQPAPVGSEAGPRLKQPQADAPAKVQSAPGVRSPSNAIRDQGPANEAPAPAIRKAATTPASAGVLDAAGVPVQGYIQVAPNRVYDPVNKRYHWTVPAGEQQQIVK